MKIPEWQVVIRTGEIRKNVRYDNLLLFRISTGCLLNIGLVYYIAIALRLNADSGRQYVYKNLQHSLNIK